MSDFPIRVKYKDRSEAEIVLKPSMLRHAVAFVVIGTCLIIPAHAQQQPTEYNLKVTPDEANLISDGLQTQPFGKVAPLMNKLRSQIMEQQPKPSSENKTEDKKE